MPNRHALSTFPARLAWIAMLSSPITTTAQAPATVRGQALLENVVVSPDDLPEIDPWRELVTDRLRNARPRFDRCYEQALRSQPALEGVLVLHARLAGHGLSGAFERSARPASLAIVAPCVERLLTSLIPPSRHSGAIIGIELHLRRLE